MSSKLQNFVRGLKTLTRDPFDDPRGREARSSLGLADYTSYYDRYNTNPIPMDGDAQRRYDILTRERNSARESVKHRESRRDERIASRRASRRPLEGKSSHGNTFTSSLNRIESQHPYSDDILYDRYGPGRIYDGNISEMYNGNIPGLYSDDI